MNIFLIGNGFDLHHKFPTRYIDFLQIVHFLIEHKNNDFKTVGDVLGNQELIINSQFIQECYEKHEHIYKFTLLDDERIKRVVSTAEKNMWFKYLCSCTTRNIGWIDFEKEIIRVVDAFEEFLDGDGFDVFENCITFDADKFPIASEARYILSQFNFFYKEFDKQWVNSSRPAYVKSEFVTERVAGSQSYHIKKDDIASKLYDSLRELADVIRDYLICFVEIPISEYAKFNIKPYFRSLPIPNRVYTFNYTNVYEKLYGTSMVNHIHENTKSNVVLGINPNRNDELYTINTTFLQFKKYFQRAFYKTDIEFLSDMKNQKIACSTLDNYIILYVIGHSLDSTDADVITQVFDISNKILILYHDDVSVKNQIKNLVNIYGKKGFDLLREEKDLVFLPESEIEWIFPE